MGKPHLQTRSPQFVELALRQVANDGQMPRRWPQILAERQNVNVVFS
jgi:hypothetical protein